MSKRTDGSILYARHATDEEIEWAAELLLKMGSLGRVALKKHREYCYAELEQGWRPLPFTAWVREVRAKTYGQDV